MNTITINGNTYNIINSTQSDGRCFSASVYYELYNNIVANSDDLNEWIQYNIINPILETEQTDCPKFLLWTTKWATIDKRMFTNKPNEPPPEVQELQNLFENLENTKKTLVNFISTTDLNPELIENYKA